MNFVQKLDFAHRMQSATALACVLLACTAFAASDGGHREHEAHEHGHGTLDIVVEGEEMVIELRIPAVNVVGFEHAPKDDAEREAVRQALVPFADAASVLVVPAEAECEVEETEAAVASMTLDDDHEGERHGDGDDHDHKKDLHETDEHARHEPEKDQHEEHEESGAEAHSELRATYHFHCHAPERLVEVEVRVFEHLRDAEEIDVRAVTATAQLAMEVRPDSTVVQLAP